MAEKDKTPNLGEPGGRPLTKGELQRMEERRRIEKSLRAARRSRWLPRKQASDTSPHKPGASVNDALTPAQQQRIEERKRIEKLGRAARRSRWLPKRVHPAMTSKPPAAPAEAASPAATAQTAQPRQKMQRPVAQAPKKQPPAGTKTTNVEELTPAQKQRLQERKHVENTVRTARRRRFGIIGRKRSPLTPEQRRARWTLALAAFAILVVIGLSIASVFERRTLTREIVALRDESRSLSAQQNEALAAVQTKLAEVRTTQEENGALLGGGFADSGSGLVRIEDRLVALTALTRTIRDLTRADSERIEAIREAVAPSPFDEREVTIDLGADPAARALFTIPRAEDGPFPGVLLIPGIEAPDFDGTIATERPLKQIAEYLASRGYAVLRFDLRVATEPGSSPDPVVSRNDLAVAMAGFEWLLAQPETRVEGATILSYGWSAALAVHLARDRHDVANVILLCPLAEELSPQWVRDQASYASTRFARTALDANGDGAVALGEVGAWLDIDDLSRTDSVSTYPFDPMALITQDASGEREWAPGIDVDRSGKLEIDRELPRFLEGLKGQATGDDRVSESLDGALSWIGDVKSSVLVLAAGEDRVAPVSQARLLAQKLDEAYHSDAEFGVYPSLGHSFQTVKSPWIQQPGPIVEQVLIDLFAWLSDRAQ